MKCSSVSLMVITFLARLFSYNSPLCYCRRFDIPTSRLGIHWAAPHRAFKIQEKHRRMSWKRQAQLLTSSRSPPPSPQPSHSHGFPQDSIKPASPLSISCTPTKQMRPGQITRTIFQRTSQARCSSHPSIPRMLSR